jgi:hypothetical protein
MGELISELSSLRFWVAVVLVGLVINLVAAYVKPALDRIISRISERYRNHIFGVDEKENQLVQDLADCRELRDIHRSEALFERIRSVWFISFSTGLFILGSATDLLIIPGDDVPAFVALGLSACGAYAVILSIKYVRSSTKKMARVMLAYEIARQAKK